MSQDYNYLFITSPWLNIIIIHFVKLFFTLVQYITLYKLIILSF